MKQHNFVFILLLCGLSTHTHAEEQVGKLIADMAGQQQPMVEGGLTVTLQQTDASGIDNELLGSFDLVSTIPAGPGEVVVYVEGNTSPLSNGVVSHYEEANSDAGSALDRDGKGRLQVSEFFYLHRFNKNSLAVGLIDPAAGLDTSDVANDETAQFLGASFVNNPTIGMPDYSLGITYHHEAGRSNDGNGYGFTLTAVSSHGLGDNPDTSYSELVDIGADGKGNFLAAEGLGQTGIINWRLGVWLNSADHDYLDGSGKTGSNMGAYLSADLDLDAYLSQSRLNLRMGMANEKVSNAAEFYAISLETPLAGNTLGAGVARTGVSSKAGSNSADLLQAEVYVRFDLSETFHVSPSVQWVENSGLMENRDDNPAYILSVRASYGF